MKWVNDSIDGTRQWQDNYDDFCWSLLKLHQQNVQSVIMEYQAELKT